MVKRGGLVMIDENSFEFSHGGLSESEYWLLSCGLEISVSQNSETEKAEDTLKEVK